MDFAKFISGILARGQLKETEIKWIVDNHIDLYHKAFTSIARDPVNNYEDLEQKGDASANAFLVWYFYNRFPQLDCPAGVPVIARLKIVYSSKATFYRIARDLGFMVHINASDSEKSSRERSLLEDVFEAFVGATQSIFDKKYELGFGFVIVCRILKSLFDDLDISLEYADLYDAKTRLKEHFDANKNIGKLVSKYDHQTGTVSLFIVGKNEPRTVTMRVVELPRYMQRRDRNKTVSVTIRNDVATVALDEVSNQSKQIASAKAPTKAEAEQLASQKALDYLKVTFSKNLSMVCS